MPDWDGWNFTKFLDLLPRLAVQPFHSILTHIPTEYTMQLPEGYSIRPARKEDCTDIFRLVDLLAKYEKSKSSIDVKTLERDGFELQHPLFHCFVATYQEKVIAFALTFRNYSTWKGCCVYLEDLYVEEEHRRKGVGRNLLQTVTKYALDIGSQRVDWICIDYNTKAQEFYEKVVGASKLSEWYLYRMNLEQMNKFAAQ